MREDELLTLVASLTPEERKFLFEILFSQLSDADRWEIIGDWATRVIMENGGWDLVR